MKRDLNEIIYVLVSFLLVYAITGDLIVSLVTAIVIILYGTMFLFKRLKDKKRKVLIMKEQNAFMSAFIVSLSVSNSIEHAHHAALELASDELRDELKLITDNEVISQLEGLEPYFDTIQFAIFINLIKIYQDVGGNILKISEHFLPVIKRLQLCVEETEALSKRKLLEFSTLWGFSFAIIVFCRLGLTDFYSRISENLLFRGLLIGLFLFFILSFHLAMKNYLHIEFLGEREHE